MDSALTSVGLPIALAIIMFGLGLGLTVADFKRVGKHPRAVIDRTGPHACHPGFPGRSVPGALRRPRTRSGTSGPRWRSDCGNPFATWEWAATWWDHFGEDRTLLITACRRPDGTLAAILPLYLSTRGRLRMARFVGHGVGDVLGPICAKRGRRAGGVRRCSRRLPTSGRSWDLLLAERMPKDRFPGLLQGQVLQEEANPLLPIDGASWDEFLASCSSNMRGQIRRKRRQLEREHGARFRLADDRGRLDADFDTLVRLHRARWGEARAFNERRSAFHRAFAARGLEQRMAAAVAPRGGGAGRRGLARVPLRRRGVVLPVRAETRNGTDRSVGLILLARTMQGAFDDGMSAYAFLRGDEEYKRRFATEDAGLETVGIARGPLGHAAVSAARAAKRMPPGAGTGSCRSLG